MTSKPKTKRKAGTRVPETDPEQTQSPPRRGRPPGRTRRPAQAYSAEQKARAVLAAWTEKASQSEICRQMRLNYLTFQNWQDRAMEGMLRALEDRARPDDMTALSPRLCRIVERGCRAPEDRLGRRLRRIQEERDNAEPS